MATSLWVYLPSFRLSCKSSTLNQHHWTRKEGSLLSFLCFGCCTRLRSACGGVRKFCFVLFHFPGTSWKHTGVSFLWCASKRSRDSTAQAQNVRISKKNKHLIGPQLWQKGTSGDSGICCSPISGWFAGLRVWLKEGVCPIMTSGAEDKFVYKSSVSELLHYVGLSSCAPIRWLLEIHYPRVLGTLTKN